ncbi:hypothetical protein [Deinococcus xianganensis]|uniref:Uncharacterized protein n=1 Tax=Deinococcus xianganensis TaxID=1507289 RepID=A0A6I4YLL7_9DEIO|nr:hypothetical protein [Deinococcus xianganensis]MXV20871.1 hypothetical protein [Deinococcus xianganensis]
MDQAEPNRAEDLKTLFLLRYDNMRDSTLRILRERAPYDMSIPQAPREAFIFGVLAALQHMDYAEEFWDALLDEYANSIN